MPRRHRLCWWWRWLAFELVRLGRLGCLVRATVEISALRRLNDAAAQSAGINTVLARNVLLPSVPMLLPPMLSAGLRSVVPLGAVGAVATPIGPTTTMTTTTSITSVFIRTRIHHPRRARGATRRARSENRHA